MAKRSCTYLRSLLRFLQDFGLIFIKQTSFCQIKLFPYSHSRSISKTQSSHVHLCDLMDCSPPGSSFHGILQERILEWVAIPFSRGSSRFRDRTWVSCIAGRFFITEPSGSPLCIQRTFSFWYQGAELHTLILSPYRLNDATEFISQCTGEHATTIVDIPGYVSAT